LALSPADRLLTVNARSRTNLRPEHTGTRSSPRHDIRATRKPSRG
jgi:hypothetical protein